MEGWHVVNYNTPWLDRPTNGSILLHSKVYNGDLMFQLYC